MYCSHCGTFNEDTAFSCGICCKPIGVRPYVGFWRRFGAYFIDGIFIYIASIAISLVISDLLIYLTLSLLLGITYYAGLESSASQATFGKQIMDVKVTDLEGNRISFGKAIIRYIFKLITGMLIIGYLTIPFTEKKQGIYDMIAGTVVIYD